MFGSAMLKRAYPVIGLYLASTLGLSAKTFNSLHSFNGADGANPYTALTQGSDGNFYGTTIDGGANGGGNFFKITPKGKLTSLYDFCSQANCNDGQYPDTTLVEGTDGSFYGTTQSGGTNGGYGTVFKISRKGKLSVLHSFDASDGAAPYGSLVPGAGGAFYGTANVGGANGGGTVFKITPKGKLTTLYNFCAKSSCSDGQYPVGGLIRGSDGNIYGTTHAGGDASCTDGCGTVFKITPKGKLTTLHRLNAAEGDYPYGGVVESSGGVFYGTTGGGGDNAAGTVFKMTRKGKLTTLHSFDVTDGATPYALTLGSDGRFYGTTSAGGANYNGTVFRITAGGGLKTMHDFDGVDGRMTFSGLVQAKDGKFYGTTYFGGDSDNGTIFSLAVRQ